jgi:hypothetical protein
MMPCQGGLIVGPILIAQPNPCPISIDMEKSAETTEQGKLQLADDRHVRQQDGRVRVSMQRHRHPAIAINYAHRVH